MFSMSPALVSRSRNLSILITGYATVDAMVATLPCSIPTFAVLSPNPGVDNGDNYGTDAIDWLDVDCVRVFGMQFIS